MIQRALLTAAALHLLLLALPLGALPRTPETLPLEPAQQPVTEPPTEAEAEAELLTETVAEEPTEAQSVTEAPTEPEAASPELPETVTVLMPEGQTEELALETYLWGVVAAEMPASFEEEALKAQAVAARSYTRWQITHPSGAHPEAQVCTDFNCCQAWLSREERLDRWPEEHRAEYADKIARAVEETAGEVLEYDNQPALTVFHASSAGQTRSAAQVWGQDFPYLASVDSPEGEDDAPNYYSVVTVPEEEARSRLEQVCGGALGEDRETWLTEQGEGYAAGETALSPQQVRALFGLRSASFTFDWEEEGLRFYVTGYGHGVGMSQYGANVLAQQGGGYREILAHYYPGTQVTKP